MGLSSSTTKTTSKPVYNTQLEGAAGNVTSAYNAAAPGLATNAAAIGGLVPGMIEKYTHGDPNVSAARGYDQSVLSGGYLHGNPELEAMIAKTNGDTRNGLAASLGTRGLTGGSAFADIIGRGLAQNESGLRYNDYNNERNRMDSAAGRAGSYSAADGNQLSQIIGAATGQMLPIQAAAGQASAMGGLLGQYTNTTQKSTPNIGMLIAQMAAQAAQAYAQGGG
jgi:hypothetical protein